MAAASEPGHGQRRPGCPPARHTAGCSLAQSDAAPSAGRVDRHGDGPRSRSEHPRRKWPRRRRPPSR
ncbi:hypothetical protein D9753_35935 [Streptomyces dangxiongensis]|uniref:Uncharacterized protein n=1 Tax=Streptomyces dangxiongensis TaxID=1442032 RepID=A0A3G2JLX8_9ACTN|nr:hypothetical protein D9753_35935 [Streptomyces dangxiongensis]